MVGVAYNFGGQASLKNLGFTAKILSSDKEDKWVGALGATFYPWSDQLFGVDVSAGYNFQDSAALIGYDFLKRGMQLSGGWVNTDNDGSNPPPRSTRQPASNATTTCSRGIGYPLETRHPPARHTG